MDMAWGVTFERGRVEPQKIIQEDNYSVSIKVKIVFSESDHLKKKRNALASSSLSLFLLLSDIWKLLRELWKSALSYLDKLQESSLLSLCESPSPSCELTLSPGGRGEQYVSKPFDNLCIWCAHQYQPQRPYLTFTSSSLSCSTTVSHFDSVLA